MDEKGKTMTQVCSNCGELKDDTLYWKNKSRLNGLHSKCIVCMRASARLQKYGIVRDAYEELLKKQNYSCAICRISGDDETLAVDHDHATGKVRGLLCGHCNKAIGMLRDSVTNLQRAIWYLEEGGTA